MVTTINEVEKEKGMSEQRRKKKNQATWQKRTSYGDETNERKIYIFFIFLKLLKNHITK